MIFSVDKKGDIRLWFLPLAWWKEMLQKSLLAAKEGNCVHDCAGFSPLAPFMFIQSEAFYIIL